jgi:NTE family protein
MVMNSSARSPAEVISHAVRLYFGASHIIASGSLPPSFPPTEIESEYNWDGGLVSNTPLHWVLESTRRQDTLAFQVNLWNARGELPCDLNEVVLRQKEIRYSRRRKSDLIRQNSNCGQRVEKLVVAHSKSFGRIDATSLR